MAFIEYVSKNSTGLNTPVYVQNQPLSFLKYAYDKKGPNGHYGIEIGLFAKSDYQSRNGDDYNRPDIQVHSFPFVSNTDYGKGWELGLNFKSER